MWDVIFKEVVLLWSWHWILEDWRCVGWVTFPVLSNRLTNTHWIMCSRASQSHPHSLSLFVKYRAIKHEKKPTLGNDLAPLWITPLRISYTYPSVFHFPKRKIRLKIFVTIIIIIRVFTSVLTDDFHWSLSDSKYPLKNRFARLYCVVIWVYCRLSRFFR